MFKQRSFPSSSLAVRAAVLSLKHRTLKSFDSRVTGANTQIKRISRGLFFSWFWKPRSKLWGLRARNDSPLRTRKRPFPFASFYSILRGHLFPPTNTGDKSNATVYLNCYSFKILMQVTWLYLWIIPSEPLIPPVAYLRVSGLCLVFSRVRAAR